MIRFLYPEVFFLLPLPFLCRWFFPILKPRTADVLRIPFFSLLLKVSSSDRKIEGQNLKIFLFAFIIWILLLVSVAAPVRVGAALPMQKGAHAVFLAIDLSGSMASLDLSTADEKLSRLDVVKKVASAFVDGRSGDKLGLILFGTEPYLRTPLTFDLKTLKQALSSAQVGLAGQFTAIGDAVGLAVKQLQDLPESNRILILLTDGANTVGALDPLAAADLAKNKGIKIYTIGVGAFSSDESVAEGGVDTATLQAMANRTGGLFFRAQDTAALAKIYEEIDTREPILKNETHLHPLTPLYFWPLSAAVFLALLWRLFFLWRTSFLEFFSFSYRK